MKVTFANEWVEKAVREVLGVSEDAELTSEELEKIRYVKIGTSFALVDGFEIELSTEEPPEPFSDTNGGDEWTCCLRGSDIGAFLNWAIEDDREKLLRPFMFGFDNAEFPDAASEEAEEAWENYKPHIVKGNDFLTVATMGQEQGFDATEQRADRLRTELYSDIKLFTGVEVLRITGLALPDYKIFHELKRLRVLELVETDFESEEGYEDLTRLQQLSCWLD